LAVRAGRVSCAVATEGVRRVRDEVGEQVRADRERSELADDEEWKIWLALEKEEPLGMIGFRPEQELDTQMLASPKTLYLSVAATKAQARGRGLNTYLTWHGLDEMRKQGYETCYTNWISPNLLASRFWPRFGFQDVAYRLAKKVSPMIAWAKDE
jgi:ribosomal protein S18 acetylase RimI-like enzyme